MKSKTNKEGKGIEINVERLDKKTPNKRTSQSQIGAMKLDSKSGSAKREPKDVIKTRNSSARVQDDASEMTS